MRIFNLHVLILISSLLVSVPLHAQRFHSDDPIWEDPDRVLIAKPAEIDDLSQALDLLLNTFAYRPEKRIRRAENINTLGEVPNSSWYTNRMSARVMTIEELVQGPDRGPGPDMTRPWVIIGAKNQGITPGFTIRDARGDIYFIKFDPLAHPQLATSTEVICTKFFYAFGYNVPQNYLARIRREDVVVGADTRITDENGIKRGMTDNDVNRIFAKVPVDSDGTVQVVASFKLEGEVIGPFKYYGTRPDDPNDIFPHEDRRELRGLRLFAAWLNHDDSRSINSKDFYVREGEEGYIKHHLIDFGSCLGSGSVRVQSRRAGNEYMIEWAPILKSALTFGLWDRSWRYIDYPDYPGIGRFEGDAFQPELWKPEYPNPAFERMLSEDAFWACRTIARFDDQMIAAITRTGKLRSAEAERYLIETLIKRRDKILRYYLTRLNPLDEFEVREEERGQTLLFKNLGEALRLGKAGSYEYQWALFDNLSGTSQPLGSVETTGTARVPIPGEKAEFLKVSIRTVSSDQPGWRKPVTVFLASSLRRVIGIERE
jgi:hypothetical protein